MLVYENGGAQQSAQWCFTDCRRTLYIAALCSSKLLPLQLPTGNIPAGTCKPAAERLLAVRLGPEQPHDPCEDCQKCEWPQQFRRHLLSQQPPLHRGAG